MKTEDTTFADLTDPGAANDFFTRRTMPPFEPDAKGFSRANALWLMELSRLVYRGSNVVPPRSSFLHKVGLEEVEFFNATDETADTQGMLVRAEHWAALVFRGTEGTPQDIITDLEIALPAFGKGAVVHRGFKHALDLVFAKTNIAAALAAVDVPLFYTGHSLGAALATLCIARHTPRAVYTFGSPLVGNRAFGETLKGVPIFRVVDDIDGVTMVPPPLLGYLHVGEEHKLSETPEPPLPIRAEKLAFDHAPVNYLDRL